VDGVRLGVLAARLDDRIGRKTNGELGATAGRVGNRYRTVHRRHDLLDDGEAKAGPVRRLIAAPEALEDLRSKLFRDARSGIDDVDRRESGDSYQDRVFARRVLDRVLDQVLQGRLECKAAGAN
jgi:hypothetical protein